MFTTVVALLSASYTFSAGSQLDYRVDVSFEGFLPVLGGNEGRADVGMDVKVLGLGADGENLKASNELTSFEISFNGSKLPLTLDNAIDYFPKTQVSLTPQGKIVKSDAPDRSLPVKLPGLDVKRFPDITYLPVEFSAKPVEVGEEWSFSKNFGGSDLVYKCQIQEVKGTLMTVAVKVRQEYTVLENDALEVVKNREDAVSEVTTVMTGTGTIVFDQGKGAVQSVRMKNQSVSTGENFVDKVKISRKLDSELKVDLKKPMTSESSAKPVARESTKSKASSGNPLTDFFDSVVRKGQEIWTTSAQWLALAKLALQFSLGTVPGGSHILKWIPGFGG